MSEAPTTETRRRVPPAVLWTAGILALILLWLGVFHMVGAMWWNAAQPTGERVPPPEPLHAKPPNTDWVDMEKYSREHPVWEPALE